VVQGMESGGHTFTILETYNQAELTIARSKQAGRNFKMPYPGETQGTSGTFVLCATVSSSTDSDAVGQPGSSRYFGGKTGDQFSPVVKRGPSRRAGVWVGIALERRGGQDGLQQWGGLGHVCKEQELARAKDGLTSSTEWDVFSRTELQKAYLDRFPPRMPSKPWRTNGTSFRRLKPPSG